MKTVKKIFVVILKKFEIGSAIAIQLTQITGKSKQPIHPKHFLFNKPWFIVYLNRRDVVLDLGSGNGQNTLKVSRVAKKVIGMELDPNLLEIAKKFAKNKKNIVFKKANLEKKLKVKNNSFDKIIFLDVLEHIVNRNLILTEVHRILKSDGLLLLSVPNAQTSWKKLQKSVGICSYSDPDHKIEFSKPRIISLLKRNKFEIIDISYSSYDTPFRGLIDLIGGFSLSLYKKLSKMRIQAARENPKEAGGFNIVARKV